MQEGDRVSSQNDEEIARKYGITQRLSANAKVDIEYYSNLYLYDTIIELVQPIDQNVTYSSELIVLGFSQRWPALGQTFFHSLASLTRPGEGHYLSDDTEPYPSVAFYALFAPALLYRYFSTPTQAFRHPRALGNQKE